MNIKYDKTIALLMLVLLQLYSCQSDYIKLPTDLEKLRLKGEVKHVMKTAYEASNYMGEIERGQQSKIVDAEPFYVDVFRELYFNTDGNITKNVFLDDNNVETSSYLYEYDKHNRLVHLRESDVLNVVVKYWDDERKSNKYTSHKGEYPWHGNEISYYDEKNNVVKIEFLRDGILKSRKIYTYNEMGKKTTEKTDPLARMFRRASVSDNSPGL